MPSPRPQSEQCVVQRGPSDKQRAVIDLVSRHVVPEIASESAGKITPAPDDRTVHDLRPVVPHKLERQRAAVNDKCNQAKQGQQNARPAQIDGQRLQCARLRLSLWLAHVAASEVDHYGQINSSRFRAHTIMSLPLRACYPGYPGVPLNP